MLTKEKPTNCNIQAMQSIQSTQFPAYHMRMKDLVAKQRVAYQALRRDYAAMNLQFKMEHNKNRILYHMRASQLAKKQEEERAALRKKHHDDRERAKAEKAYLAPSKLEPDFWNYYPNHDGRRDTMVLVMKSLHQPAMPLEQMNKLMPAYAEWLLTSTHGKKDRWSLMTAFVNERLVV